MWGEAIDAFQKNVYSVEKEDGCVFSLLKHSVNGLCKGFALVAMAVVAVATPVFAFFDVIYGTAKALFYCEVKPMSKTSILDFYRSGKETHDTGLTLDQILDKDNEWLEKEHDFIQWLFPTEQVGVNRNAPLSNAETQEAFKADPGLQANMQRAFERMLKFYGMEKTMMGSISSATDHRERIANLLAHPHNNLRITRILTSLRLHGLEDEASHFIKMLEALADGNPKLQPVYEQYWAPAAGIDGRVT
jgi:hypothetical protein